MTEYSAETCRGYRNDKGNDLCIGTPVNMGTFPETGKYEDISASILLSANICKVCVYNTKRVEDLRRATEAISKTQV